ncbi:phage antirepressor N-terminal domain-containing protein [Macellibacteroides fermentans]|uniref:phage antirepressor N-terminal domain-containing protein n=1 Tax=Macellibacteroides fermentans TaxID=879969 RepID=UPI00406C6E72
METKTIARVNSVAIVAGNDPKKLVPIKPICDALGIDFPNQFRKIKEDEDLNSTVVLSTMVASDGKDREMACLPIEFVFGWLFTINPKNVKEDARESVRKYRMECYRALYSYFTEYAEFVEIRSQVIDRHMDEYQRLQRDFSQAKNNMEKSRDRLNEAKALTFEKYKEEKSQFKLDFLAE